MLIAEIGQAHEGSLGIAHSYIDALAETGVDAIKWQTHIAHAESSLAEPFRVKFSYEDSTRYDYWKRMEFSLEQWKGLKKHCDEVGIEFISSPFSNAAVDLLENLNVKRYKIGSGEINNHLMLNKIASTGKPVIISSGMSDLGEIDQAVSILQPHVDLTVMQCYTAYPTLPEQWGLNFIQTIKERYGTKVGFSDHSGTIAACIAASALGADTLEFHVVFDKRMFGPDAKSSLTLDETKLLVDSVKSVKTSLAAPIDKNDIINFKHLKSIFEKSLAVNKTLLKGHILTFNDLEAKKPSSEGIKASEYKDVIGKMLTKNIDAWSFLKVADLHE